MPDRARLGTAAALGVLLPLGPAVAHAAPAVNQSTLAAGITDIPPGLWGLLGLLGLFGLVGLSRRGPKRNAKNPLAGYGGEDELARGTGRHHAPPAPRTGSPMDILPGGDRGRPAERPPTVRTDQPVAPRPDYASMSPGDVPRPDYAAAMSPGDPARPDHTATPPGDLPRPDYASMPPAEQVRLAEPYGTREEVPSGAQPMPYGTREEVPSGSQPAMPYGAYAEAPSQAAPAEALMPQYAEAPSAPPAMPNYAALASRGELASATRVPSPMDTAPTTPTPAQYSRTPEPYPQTDQDPPAQQPAVPQQHSPTAGTGSTFAGLPRYPETATPDPGPVDAGPRHRR
ncbi:hypothetical protein [Amycolatopsis thermophila]|uniref:Uncharacterized protein n=1 Tax=Amycolatopsis thermophila TaxID=206084 RepID=A0ABU0EQP2_9PSEU|nr:hypothetical protein [Amycolatopsis thermophila]MDQ0377393.1 hypothetical protein [Amycolatopsis thermophila]